MIIEVPYGEKCPNRDIKKTSQKTCKDCPYVKNVCRTFCVCKMKERDMVDLTQLAQKRFPDHFKRDEEGFLRDSDNDVLYGFEEGYKMAWEQAVAEAERWIRGNTHHFTCWNKDEQIMDFQKHMKKDFE